MFSTIQAVSRLTVGLVILITSAGCGQKLIYPVKGQLVDKEGNPVAGMKGGSVEVESLDHKAAANGRIDENGNFQLSTQTPGDGAYLGKHRVLIIRPFVTDAPSPHVVHPKYEKQETTDLFITIEPRSNVIKLEVELHRP